LGVILYYCLSGDLPFFSSGTDEELFDLVRRCEWEFSNNIWDDVSEEAKDLITKLLVRDPKQRLNCSQIMEHAWFSKFY
jgi:serine/threonine protein kinase